MRLDSGQLWPIPITLDVDQDFVKKIAVKQKITLRDKEGFALAILTINDVWKANYESEALSIYNTLDQSHPGVSYLFKEAKEFLIGGKVQKIEDPHHYDYKTLRHNPKDLKKYFFKKKWKKIVAFQTRNPLHKAHVEMTLRSIKELNAKLLLHPVIGMTKPGDVDHHTRVRCYKHVMKRYPKDSALLSLLPLAMRMAGPKEALWHALIRKNYGCTHLVVGRDHAGPGLSEDGNSFYGPYEAQELLIKHEKEIGIKMVPFKFMVYIPSQEKYDPLDILENDMKYETLSGTDLRKLLDDGKGIPEWFTYPDVAKELEKSTPPLLKRGLTIFFTGLSGSGKSTLANGLLEKFLENGSRPVTLLDGDIVRTHLSSELGFSKKHRSLNIQRIGFVASEITKNGGLAICAPIAPYSNDRKINRKLISRFGGYIEIYVNTSLAKCEERDVKGLYKLAREGKIKEFTGISDPYEAPKTAEIIIDSSSENPDILVDQILKEIKYLGYID